MCHESVQAVQPLHANGSEVQYRSVGGGWPVLNSHMLASPPPPGLKLSFVTMCSHDCKPAREDEANNGRAPNYQTI